MSLLCLGAEGMACSGIWLIMVFLFLIAAMLKKQLDEILGMDFSMPGGAIVGILSFIIIFLVTKSAKWGFIISLILLIVAGFIAGPYLGGGEE